MGGEEEGRCWRYWRHRSTEYDPLRYRLWQSRYY